MKRTLNLSIPTPCTEKWENFEPRPTGGFCGTCRKTVVDLTRMSDDQVIDFFRNKPGHTCGRLRTDQLRSYTTVDPIKINLGFPLFRTGLLSLFLLLTGKVASAQQMMAKPNTEIVQNDQDILADKSQERQDGFVITGVVKDQYDQSPLPGVNVILRGTEVGISTDSEGRFTFPRELDPGDVLIISFIGYETQVYTVPRDFKEEEIVFLIPMETLSGEIVVGGAFIEPSRFQKWWSRMKALF